jgi:VCBS repeat-containing protein
VAGANGTFSIAANGAWTYTANSAFDNLNVGQSVSDSFTVASADGTTSTVQVTINGTNDAAVLSSASVALTETDAPLSTGGTLTISDVDSAQTFAPQTNVAGAYGTFSLAADGTWSYTANSAFDNLNVGQSVSDTFTVASADGTTSTVQVTINGTNDAAVVSSATVSLSETNAPLTTGGTLTVSDVDDALTFAPQTNVAGANGVFSIATDGTWTYTANSAFDSLNVGQSVSDTFTVASADGTTSTVQVTINGTNDAAVLSSAVTTLAETDTPLTTGGTLTVSDVDDGQTFAPQTNVAGANGTFSIAANGAWTYTANGAFDSLNVGQSVSDTFTVAAAEGTTSTVQVTINGTNDAAVLSSASVALSETNAALSTGGTLTVADVDSAQTFVPQTNVAGMNGTFSVAANGAWTYTANSAFDNLNVGQSVSDRFTVASADGTTTSVQVTINGTNDAAVVSSATVALAETNAPLTTGGTLTVSDVDSAQTFVPQTNVAGANGTFSIAANGSWTYTANSAFDSLNVGQSVSDTFTVASADGTTTTVQVTINGTNDAAVLSSATVTLAETNAALTTGGTLTVSDVDSAQTFVPQTNVAGTNGTFSIAANGAWTYTANSAFDSLNVGQSVSDMFTVSSVDGTTSTVQVTINGTNDAAVVSSATIVLAETNAPLTTGGTLTVSDVDNAQSFVPQTNVAGANGVFSIAANGAWTYTANSAFDSLNVGQSVSDTFTVSSADGTTSTVRVTINGTNDAALVSSATVTLAETDVPLSTGGMLSISDVDSPQSFVAQTNVAGANGTFSITANGAWTYTANSAFDNLNVGQSVSDLFTVASSDGSSATVRVTITGTDEVAVVSSQTTLPTPASASPQTLAQAVLAPEPAVVVARPSAAIPLGLPVDGAVAASNLAAQPTVAAIRWPEGTSAGTDADGPSVDGGFPVARLLPGQAGIMRVSDLDNLGSFTGGGQRLFVYRGIPDMRLLGGGNDPLTVPQDAFAHTDPHAIVILEARLASGAPLPSWLSFDGARGEFAGTPPDGLQGSTEVEVVARDTEGREAHAFFALQVDTLRAAAGERGDPARAPLGVDVDKQEAEKARAEAAREPAQARPAAAKDGPGALRPQRQGAASFSEQVSAAKAKDPLLERIARARENR